MKTKKILLIMLLLLVAFTTGCCAKQKYGPSFSEERTADKDKMWYYGFNSRMKAIVSSPLLMDDRLYVTSIGGDLFSIDKERGQFIATFKFNAGRPLKGGFRSKPVTDGKSIYVGSFDHNLNAVDPGTGVITMTFVTNGKIEGAPALMDDRIYVGNWQGRLYCVNVSDGTEVWYYEAVDKIRCTPAAFDGRIYFGDASGKFYCIVAGEKPLKLWEFKAGKEIYGEPVTDGEFVWLTSLDGNIYCLDAKTGEKKWEYATGAEIWAGPHLDKFIADGAQVNQPMVIDPATMPEGSVISSEGTVQVIGKTGDGATSTQYNTQNTISPPPELMARIYVGSMDARFYILDAYTGELAKFKDPTSGEEKQIEPIVCGNGVKYDQGVRGSATTDSDRVYFGAGDFVFRALNKRTGEQVWTFPTLGQVWDKPLVYEGKIVFGCEDSYFYGLKTDSGFPVKGAL